MVRDQKAIILLLQTQKQNPIMHKRKVVLYIAMSLDGFIADENDDLSWLSAVEKEGEDYGYNAMQERSDTYIVGRKTYEMVLQLTGGMFPQSKMYKCYVITRQTRERENGVTFFNGEIEWLITKLKREEGKDIYCDGGGEIVKLLMQKNLIDEYIISVIPTILGNGKRLFIGGIERFPLKAIASKYYA
jgi:dihydrofolate reductase